MADFKLPIYITEHGVMKEMPPTVEYFPHTDTADQETANSG